MRFTSVSVIMVAASALAAAPMPQGSPAPLVAKLSDPSEKVRNEAAAALKGRTDALPWLRRAARSTDKATAQLAAELLTPVEKKRQEIVPKAIDACIRDGCIDLLTEWHQYWQPDEEAKLWPVGPRATKAGLDLYAKSCPKAAWEQFEKELAWTSSVKTSVHNGPCPERFEAFKGAWLIRTDRLDGGAQGSERISFASVAGPVQLSRSGGRYLVLGPVEAKATIGATFIACDGGVNSPNRVRTRWSFIVCRGNINGELITDSVLLVDGDIDLTRASDINNSLMRASGEIRLPRNVKPMNCDIKAHVKDATAPYKFFELTDVGLSLVPDQKNVVVNDVKENTPFGDYGIAKGDIIQAIDDTDVKDSEEFRKKLRRALVRQGDCLITVVRDGKTIDLPVFFPMPK